MRTHLYILYGTRQGGHTPQGQPQGGTLKLVPDIIANCPGFLLIPIPGVGSSFPGSRVHGRRRLSRLFQWVDNTFYRGRRHRLMDDAVAYSMKERILYAWERTRSISPESDDQVIFFGCSRGGFSAQIFAQIVHEFGYARSPEHIKEVEEKLLKRTENAPLRQEEPQNIIHALYALDPVGTCGVMNPIRAFVLNRHATPARFFGYNTKTLPRAVERARVVLMASEPKRHYQANVLNDVPNPDRLLQLWFKGVHGDAWGPSKLALHVLAYLVKDLQDIHHILDATVTEKCSELWNGSRVRPDPAKVWSLSRRFSDQRGERLHVSAPLPPLLLDPPVQQYKAGERELFEQLDALPIWVGENVV